MWTFLKLETMNAKNILCLRQLRCVTLPQQCHQKRLCSQNPFGSQSSPDKLDASKIQELQVPLYDTHLLTTNVQKAVLGVGSSVVALADPYRADMVAVSGEVLGHKALELMYEKMKNSKEGRTILKERPTINTSTVDFKYLKSLPDYTLGHVYANFCEKHHITPDSRDPVQYVDDESLAYVMKRYRYFMTRTQCGNFRIFLSFRFYVKSTLKNVEVLKLPSFAIFPNLRFRGCKTVK